MKIQQEILSKIERDYFFIVGTINIDENYFINKIEEGIKYSSLNFKTNVVGQMTEWKFFRGDKKFIEIIFKFLDYLDNNKITKEAYFLKEAWGIKESFGGYTKEHKHFPNYLSGSIYLNNHSQKLYFPDIKKEVEPKKGTFVLFSSFLKHYTNRNNTNKSKYALAFNFDYTTIDDIGSK
tara:strand:- start:119 stop:655 length:537 start_codon:yes stop_codon:yes gene_type:complete